MVDDKIMRQLREGSDFSEIHGSVEGGRAILSPVLRCRSCGVKCTSSSQYDFSTGTVKGNRMVVGTMSDTVKDIPYAISMGYMPHRKDCCSQCIPSGVSLAREGRVWIS